MRRYIGPSPGAGNRAVPQREPARRLNTHRRREPDPRSQPLELSARPNQFEQLFLETGVPDVIFETPHHGHRARRHFAVGHSFLHGQLLRITSLSAARLRQLVVGRPRDEPGELFHLGERAVKVKSPDTCRRAGLRRNDTTVPRRGLNVLRGVDLLDQPAPDGMNHRLEAVVSAKLLVDVVQMVPERLRRDAEAMSDL
jgi:hypothetical protein